MTKRKSHKIGTLDDAQKTAIGALALVARIRAAVGDPEGRLMQDELIEHCRQMRDLLTRADDALENYGLGSEGSPLRSSIRHVLTLRGSSIQDETRSPNHPAAPSVGALSEPQAQRERCALAPGSVFRMRDLERAAAKLAKLPKPVVGIVCRPDVVGRVRRMADAEAQPLLGAVTVYEKQDQAEPYRAFYDREEMHRYLSPNGRGQMREEAPAGLQPNLPK